MIAPIQIKADLLKTLMVEDRNEVRSFRVAIYQATYILTLFSFALSAFVIEKTNAAPLARLTTITDAFIIIFIWVGFVLLKTHLVHARQGLKKRQELIDKLSPEDDASSFNPFPDARDATPDIRDLELWWLPIFATVAIAIKAAVLAAAISVPTCPSVPGVSGPATLPPPGAGATRGTP